MKRRDFIRNTGAAGLAFTVVPSHAVSGLGHTPPSDKLNIAGIGVGGKGKVNLRNMVGQNIVALCDCDYAYAGAVFNAYPKAKTYWYPSQNVIENVETYLLHNGHGKPYVQTGHFIADGIKGEIDEPHPNGLDCDQATIARFPDRYPLQPGDEGIDHEEWIYSPREDIPDWELDDDQTQEAQHDWDLVCAVNGYTGP